MAAPIKRLVTTALTALLLTSCQRFPQRVINFESIHDKEFSPTVYMYDANTALEAAERFDSELSETRYSQGAHRAVTVPDGTRAMLSLVETPRSTAMECIELLKPTDIQHLKLAQTPVIDADLKKISSLTGLEIINLEGGDPVTFYNGQNFVTDTGVRYLLSLPQLTSINLSNTFVTDAILRDLETRKSLKHLIVTGTQITEPAIEKFKASRPDCKVTYERASDGHIRGLALITQGLNRVFGQKLDTKILEENEWDDDSVEIMVGSLLEQECVSDGLDEAISATEALPGQKLLTFPRKIYLPKLTVSIYDKKDPLNRKRAGKTYGSLVVPADKQVVVERLDDLEDPALVSEMLSLLKPGDLNRIDLHSATDDDLKMIARFTGLSILDLSGSGVTDEGLPALAPLSALQALDLSGTGVTGAGLAAVLPQFKQLRHLSLKGVFLTRAELVDLKQAIPWCAIYTEAPRE